MSYEEFEQIGCQLYFQGHKVADFSDCLTSQVNASSDSELCGIAQSIIDYVTELNEDTLNAEEAEAGGDSVVIDLGTVTVSGLAERLLLSASKASILTVAGIAVLGVILKELTASQSTVSSLRADLTSQIKDEAKCSLYKLLKRDGNFSFTLLRAWAEYVRTIQFSGNSGVYQWTSMVDTYANESLWATRAEMGRLTPLTTCEVLCSEVDIPATCDLFPLTVNSLLTPLGNGNWRLEVPGISPSGAYVGSYRLPFTDGCCKLEITNVITPPQPMNGVAALVKECGSDVVTSLSDLSSLEGVCFNQFGIVSAVECELEVHVTDCQTTPPVETPAQLYYYNVGGSPIFVTPTQVGGNRFVLNGMFGVSDIRVDADGYCRYYVFLNTCSKLQSVALQAGGSDYGILPTSVKLWECEGGAPTTHGSLVAVDGMCFKSFAFTPGYYTAIQLLPCEQPQSTLAFDSETSTVYENATSAHNVALRLSISGGGTLASAVSVDMTLGGTAQYGTDYTIDTTDPNLSLNGSTLTVTIPSGSIDSGSGIVQNIPVVMESGVTLDRTITLQLANPTGGAILGATTLHTVTIVNYEWIHIFDFTQASGSEPNTTYGEGGWLIVPTAETTYRGAYQSGTGFVAINWTTPDRGIHIYRDFPQTTLTSIKVVYDRVCGDGFGIGSNSAGRLMTVLGSTGTTHINLEGNCIGGTDQEYNYNASVVATQISTDVIADRAAPLTGSAVIKRITVKGLATNPFI